MIGFLCFNNFDPVDQIFHSDDTNIQNNMCNYVEQ